MDKPFQFVARAVGFRRAKIKSDSDIELENEDFTEIRRLSFSCDHLDNLAEHDEPHEHADDAEHPKVQLRSHEFRMVSFMNISVQT